MTQTTLSFPFRRHALALALALATGASSAATINVRGACTLVNAINNANADADTDGAGGCPAGSGADVLALEANSIYTLAAVDNVTNESNGLPSVTSVITINGNDATVQRSSASGTPEFRLIHVAAAGDLTINRLTLTGGKIITKTGSGYSFREVSGGGIFNLGALSLTDSTVSGNSVYFFGGGIHTDYQGTTTLTNSSVSGNSAMSGGGIYNNGVIALKNTGVSGNTVSGSGGGIQNLGQTTVVNSTISGNSASVGGGFLSWGGTVTVTNSTLSSNSAYFGGGVYIFGYFHNTATLTNSTISGNSAIREGGGFALGWWPNITLTNCTVSDNNAPTGGAVFDQSHADYPPLNYAPSIEITHSTLTNNGGLSAIATSTTYYYGRNLILTNSIVANSAGSECDALTVPTLLGKNLIEDGSCGAPLSGDPKLRTLLDNGGLTFTHALHGDSPALAAADKTLCPNTDQRNVKRPPKNKAACDLGAFERKPVISTTVAPLVSFFDTAAANGGISGVNNFDERIALRNQLLTAGDYKQRNLAIQACSQLSRTLGYIDADNSPETGDYVFGSAAQALADEINALKTSWSCQQP